MTDLEQPGSDRMPFAVNGHSIDLDGFTFMCQNDDCELADQSYAVVRHAASKIDCPVEQIVDGGGKA